MLFFLVNVFVWHSAISRLKDEKLKCSGTQDPLVSEEFVPLKTNSGGNGYENESSEKKNWMSSAQLWSTQKTKSVKFCLIYCVCVCVCFI